MAGPAQLCKIWHLSSMEPGRSQVKVTFINISSAFHLCYVFVWARVKFKPTPKEMNNKGLHCPQKLAGMEYFKQCQGRWAWQQQQLREGILPLLPTTVTSVSENSAAKTIQLSSAWFSEWKMVQNTEGKCDREDCHTHTHTQKAGFTSKRLLLFSIVRRTLTCPARQASAAPASSPALCPTPWRLRAAISLHPYLTPFPLLYCSTLHLCPWHVLLGRPGSKSLCQPRVYQVNIPRCFTFPSCKFPSLISTTFSLL